MTVPSGSAIRRAYIAEVTPGTTPSTPTFQVMRTTSGSMRNNKQTGQSAEIQADRNVRQEYLLGLGASGSYPVEMTYGSHDALMAAALFGTWSTNVLKNGITRQFFTFEETYEMGATDSFRRFPMSMVSRMQLSMEARREITASFDIMARQEALATAAISGATYTAANTKTVMTSGVSVGSLTVGTLSDQPRLTSFSLDVNNNLRERPTIGSLYTDVDLQFGEGLCDVTGSFTAYFTSNELYQAVLDHGGGEIEVTLGHVADEHYTILLPNAVFLDGAVQVGGGTEDVMMQVPFRAQYDASEACSIKITRAVA